MSKALKAAIEANDAAATEKAARTVKDLSRKLPGTGVTPLMYACQKNADQAVTGLLAAGAPVDGATGYAGAHLFVKAVDLEYEKVLTALMQGLAPLPTEVVDYALFHAALHGKADVLAWILRGLNPHVGERVIDVATWWKGGRVLRPLLKNNVDINIRNTGVPNHENRGKTALHSVAAIGHVEGIHMLIAAGATGNPQDALGRTPLIDLCAHLAQIEASRRQREEWIASGKQITRTQRSTAPDKDPADGLLALQTLLQFNADATLRDRFNNDALMYYRWQARHEREAEDPAVVTLLQNAGATGDTPTWALFTAIFNNDIAAAQHAIAAGADVNRTGPAPTGATPLTAARSVDMACILLDAGADPNRPSRSSTPLVIAARGGDIPMAKLLLDAGADLHALEPRLPKSECLANAYSAAQMNRKEEMVAWLKSLGARKAVLKDWKPLAPGVHMWENFSEVVVKGDAAAVAAALAKAIGATATLNAYGHSFPIGAESYLVIRPVGMPWCNVLQIAPARGLLDRPTKICTALAAAQFDVLLLNYSDTSGAGDVERFHPDGTSSRTEEGYLEELQELVSATGKDAPDWARKKLAAAKKRGQEIDSERSLDQLAKAEKFAVAWGSLDGTRTVEVAFTNLPAEAFDGVAWVSKP